MDLKNKLKNAGIGLVALTGAAMSSCEKENDYKEFRQEHIQERKQETLDRLTGHSYAKVGEPSAERINFNKQDKTATIAEPYETSWGPLVFKDQETYKIDDINLEKGKIELKGHEDITLEGKCKPVTSDYPRKIQNVNLNGNCYIKTPNPRDFSQIEGEQKYEVGFRQNSREKDTLNVNFQESNNQDVRNYMQVGSQGFDYENNGNEAPYIHGLDADKDGKNDTLYFKEHQLYNEGFSDKFMLMEKDGSKFNTAYDFEKIN